MARITTGDCERVVPNRFRLVLLAAQRAHELWNGAEPQVPPGDEKPTVLALREIAAKRICPDVLQQRLIERLAPSARAIRSGQALETALIWGSSPAGDAARTSDESTPSRANQR